MCLRPSEKFGVNLITKLSLGKTKKLGGLTFAKAYEFRPPSVWIIVTEPAFVGWLEGVAFTNPLQMLLNQKRIESLGNLSVKEWLDAFALQKHSDLEKLRAMRKISY